MESSGSSSSPEEPRKTATLLRKERNINMDNAGQECLAVNRARLGERNNRRRRISSKRISNNAKKIISSIKEDTNTNGSNEEDEKVEVEKKIVALQKIVPGGESLGVDIDKLFEETAGYIMELQYQVKALKFLASAVEGNTQVSSKVAEKSSFTARSDDASSVGPWTRSKSKAAATMTDRVGDNQTTSPWGQRMKVLNPRS
ncbi:hypothetical protein ACH5RR_037351 [Cinchona calisaya]|uniref:Uncharacterized protein n=1 Tax=Cinchona calisaya TaxID=153742 RepID=A0ABD2Y5V5_9GENT